MAGPERRAGGRPHYERLLWDRSAPGWTVGVEGGTKIPLTTL